MQYTILDGAQHMEFSQVMALLKQTYWADRRPPEQVKKSIGPWAASAPADWACDPRMPVNMAETVAKAGIPVYLVYGGADDVVPPETNCELFIPRFKAAGGKIKVDRRGAYGHHPHGLEIDDRSIADFFRGAAVK